MRRALTAEVIAGAAARTYSDGMRDDMPEVGRLLAAWRARRGLSQLQLSFHSGVSTKHISFIETGRSAPSRAMLLDLCDALAIPLRLRNDVLLAGGYAPAFRETPIEDETMAEAAQALGFILRAAEPFGAVVFDRRWDVVMANQAYIDWTGGLLGPHVRPCEVVAEPRPNIVALLAEAPAYRELVANWDEVAGGVMQRLRADLAGRPDAHLQDLLARLRRARRGDRGARSSSPLLPVRLGLDGRTVRLVNTISTLGAAQDLTLRDLRIEMFHAVGPTDMAAVQAWSAARRQARETRQLPRMARM